MRKRTINHWFDTFMWYFIYLLPLFIFLFFTIRTGQLMPLTDCVHNIGFSIFTDNIVYTALDSLFGTAGVVPLFASVDIIAYLSYFVCVYLVHLAVDVLLFIPKYAHKFMDCFGGDKHD